jgi:hypothetical protein
MAESAKKVTIVIARPPRILQFYVGINVKTVKQITPCQVDLIGATRTSALLSRRWAFPCRGWEKCRSTVNASTARAAYFDH